MKKKVLLNNFESDFFDDCIISSINLSKKVLEVIINEDGLSTYWKEKNAQRLIISFILNENFIDETFIPSVRKIYYKTFFRRQTLQYYTLKHFIECIFSKGIELEIYSLYYNFNKCLLLLNEVSKGKSRGKRCEYEIELLIDEITYEWE